MVLQQICGLRTKHYLWTERRYIQSLMTRTTILIAVSAIVLFPLRPIMTTHLLETISYRHVKGECCNLTQSLYNTFSVALVTLANLHANVSMHHSFREIFPRELRPLSVKLIARICGGKPPVPIHLQVADTCLSTDITLLLPWLYLCHM
jgi:succinate dehydrogenase hydrophobic anchor subunit